MRTGEEGIPTSSGASEHKGGLARCSQLLRVTRIPCGHADSCWTPAPCSRQGALCHVPEGRGFQTYQGNTCKCTSTFGSVTGRGAGACGRFLKLPSDRTAQSGAVLSRPCVMPGLSPVTVSPCAVSGSALTPPCQASAQTAFAEL